MFIYIGSTLRNLADALRGDLSGGDDDEDSSSSTIRMIALIIGLIATIVVTIFITVTAKKKLDGVVDEGADEEAAKTGFDVALATNATQPAPKQFEPTLHQWTRPSKSSPRNPTLSSCAWVMHVQTLLPQRFVSHSKLRL